MTPAYKLIDMLISALLLITAPKVDLDIVYAKVGADDLKMDIYYPTTSKAGPVPALVVVHGGAWMGGKRQDMKELCEGAAAKGFLAATVQYRLAPRSKWPAMIDDVQTAVRYLRANSKKYDIDPKRIAAGGASAGGHLSLLLGYRDTRDPKPTLHPNESSRVGAVLDIFGPTDLGRDYPATFDFLYQAVFGKPKSESAKDVEEASPITYASKGVPTFIIHGTADAVVPIVQSKRLQERLKDAKVPVDAVYIEGMGHDTGGSDAGRKKAFRDAVNRGLDFLLEHLK